jgi:hypothetical protein
MDASSAAYSRVSERAHLRVGLQGYSHKRSWEFRKEPMTENELGAWREVLAFFTGLSQDDFPAA